MVERAVTRAADREQLQVMHHILSSVADPVLRAILIKRRWSLAPIVQDLRNAMQKANDGHAWQHATERAVLEAERIIEKSRRR